MIGLIWSELNFWNISLVLFSEHDFSNHKGVSGHPIHSILNEHRSTNAKRILIHDMSHLALKNPSSDIAEIAAWKEEAKENMGTSHLLQKRLFCDIVVIATTLFNSQLFLKKIERVGELFFLKKKEEFFNKRLTTTPFYRLVVNVRILPTTPY